MDKVIAVSDNLLNEAVLISAFALEHIMAVIVANLRRATKSSKSLVTAN